MENIEKMELFLSKLSEIEDKYKKEKENKEQFNVFTALHNQFDERRLHSRFISYLLSLNLESGKIFLEAFIKQIPQINNFLENADWANIEVAPNEKNKSEFENIDIFIWNKKTNQEIIIENKIFAGDSNHQGNKIGYNGQLERYYNTVTTGEDKDEKPVYYEGNKCKCDKTFVVYLTLNADKPSSDSRGETLQESDVICISYREEIKRWLEKCIEITQDKVLLRDSIQQYLDLTIKITNDVEKALKLKNEIAKNIDLAWQNKEKIIELEDFKHVKWHTVHEFWTELAKQLKIEMPETLNKGITKVTHYNSNKTKLIIRFTFHNEELQIVNDAKGFTLGNLTQGRWGAFSEKIPNIKFCNFEKEDTFHLINEQYREEIIAKIITAAYERYDKLENVF
ncbi:MAG: PD-(D/E)XK nuclease family protein [Bacteroidales bacterium]|jgi:DNA-binding cell septation regulator SpoVG|nr:PD-(D/E)XK nuclease family protein [Bacteroidales bacterium]